MKKTIRAPHVGTERWEINFRCHPWIDGEDATAAIHARLDQRRNSRERISEQVIIEDLFIASLVNSWPPNQKQKEKLIELLSDKKFSERLARAIATGKSPTWDNIDILILQNWRELHLDPKITAKLGKLPGLRDWSPMAAEAFFQFAKLKRERRRKSKSKSKSEPDLGTWFTKRRKRLGQDGQHRYEIKNFIVINDSPRVIR